MKLTTKEQVIKYLLSLDREYNNKLSVDVSRTKFESSEISSIGEDEFINQLSILETEGYILVNFRTGYRDLKYYITVILYDKIINYFEDKKQKKIERRNQWIQFWIPICFSVIAIILSICSLVLQYVELVQK